MLDDPAASPTEADDTARRTSGRVALDDPRRVAGLARWLVGREALDGSTSLSVTLLASALRTYGVDEPVRGVELAEEQDRLVALPEERAVALPEVAHAEESVAEEALRLHEGGQLSLVVGPAAQHPDPEAMVVADAHRLLLHDIASRLAAVVGDQRVVLCGDPDALPPAGPGRPFGDLIASGLLPVTVTGWPVESHLERVLTAVRGGRLPPVPADQRDVVVVPCDDAAQAVARTSQLVTTSIPRLLGQIGCLVLAVREDGAAGATALREAVGADVATVHQAAGRRCAAVVLVLPGEAAGSLTRALLVSALSVAQRHVSIVHAAGPALTQAVAAHPHRPRRTRLPALLREMSA